MANRYIPTVRAVEHHLDSLRALSIREGDRKLELDFKMSAGEVRRKWSCRAHDIGKQSYATLWSREVSISSLESELGVRFTSDGRQVLPGTGPQVELRVGDTTYAPMAEDHGPARKAVLYGETTDTYIQNTLHFSRMVDGTDVLQDARQVAVEIDGRDRYAWEW